MIITEEQIDETVKYLFGEGAGTFDRTGKPMWEKSDVAHISENRILMTPTIGTAVFSNRTIRTFHVTSIEGVKGIKKLVQQKKPISSFTFMEGSMVSNMRGIQTSGGVIFEILGKTLYPGMHDIMSRPDQRGGRWLDNSTVIPSSLRSKFLKMVNDWRDENESFLINVSDRDLQNMKVKRVVASYVVMCNNFVKENSEEIRRNALSRNVSYHSWNEILVYKIEARDVLWTTSKADWSTAFEMIKDKIANGRDIDDSEVAFVKECRRKIHELQNELKEFCTGEVRYTQDTHDAIIWVLEKGGNIKAEEYQKKLEKMRRENIYKEDI
jgi:hypothetical protein